MQIECAHCGKQAEKRTAEVNRALVGGYKLYCGRECSGFGRRNGKTTDERKAEKAIYDAAYRQRDPEALKARKAAYYQLTRDPVREAAIRKERMHLHVNYCQRPEYREWKRTYDRQYRAKKYYGDFAECFLLTLAIRDECLSRMTDYEIRLEKGTLNKALQRKRHDQRIDSKESEIGPLGNLERGERGQNGRLSCGRYRLTSQRNPSDHEHSTPHRIASETACSG